MKTWKKWTLLAIIALLGIIVGFTACDSDNGTTEQPQDWSETSLSLFGGRNATISGKGLTATEWNNARTAIAGKINTTHNVLEGVQKAVLETTFEDDVKIIVEKNPNGYNVWKTPGYPDFILYINFDKIDSLDVYLAISGFGTPNETIN